MNKKIIIQAGEDVLWLHCPKINGIEKSINLLQPNKENLDRMLRIEDHTSPNKRRGQK